MTDPIALAVAFLGNLEAKIINIHRRYFGYYFKIYVLIIRSHVLSAILFLE